MEVGHEVATGGHRVVNLKSFGHAFPKEKWYIKIEIYRWGLT
jgi:hypothetical protein